MCFYKKDVLICDLFYSVSFNKVGLDGGDEDTKKKVSGNKDYYDGWSSMTRKYQHQKWDARNTASSWEWVKLLSRDSSRGWGEL